MNKRLVDRIDQESALRLVAVGFFVGIAGAAMAFTLFPRFGYAVTALGIVLGQVGVVTFFVLMLRAKFRADDSIPGDR